MMTAKMGERDSREEIMKAFRLFDDDESGARGVWRAARCEGCASAGLLCWHPRLTVAAPQLAPLWPQGSVTARPWSAQPTHPRVCVPFLRCPRRLHHLQEPQARGQGAGREPDGRGDPGDD